MEQFISKAATLIEALPYLQKYRDKVFVFKYGGSAMQDEALREHFLKDIVLLKHVGIHPILVHGGGPQIQQTLTQLGVRSDFVNGLRVTDEQVMKVVEMVLVGSINSGLVNTIHKMGGTAVGFSGTDGKMILAEKMAPQEIKDQSGGVKNVDLGLVGVVKEVNPRLLADLIEDGSFIPVISPIGFMEGGVSLNINADTVACEIAKALGAEKLILVTDVSGILDETGQVLSKLDTTKAQKLIANGVIAGGMIPKVRAALDALAHGVHSATILDGRVQHAVLLEIFTHTGVGTFIQ